MLISTAAALTLGKMACSLAAAATAFGAPPSRQSSNSYRLWRTGLEYDTLELSTSVMPRTPQPNKVLATAQPSVPAGVHSKSLSRLT